MGTVDRRFAAASSVSAAAADRQPSRRSPSARQTHHGAALQVRLQRARGEAPRRRRLRRPAESKDDRRHPRRLRLPRQHEAVCRPADQLLVPGAVHRIAPRLRQHRLLGVEHVLPADGRDDTARPLLARQQQADDLLLPMGTAHTRLSGESLARSVGRPMSVGWSVDVGRSVGRCRSSAYKRLSNKYPAGIDVVFRVRTAR